MLVAVVGQHVLLLLPADLPRSLPTLWMHTLHDYYNLHIKCDIMSLEA
jgi:hypothetical protein